MHPTNQAIRKSLLETGIEPFRVIEHITPEKVQVVVKTAVKSAFAKDLISPTKNIESITSMREGLNTKAGKAGGAVFFLYSIIGLLRSIEEGDTKKDLTEGWQGPWFREWMKGIAEMQLGGAESFENMTIDNLMYYITSIYKPREQARILAEIPESLHNVFIEPLLWVGEKMEGYDTPPATPMNAIRGQSTPEGQYPPSVQQ